MSVAGKVVNIIRNLRLREVSAVDNPANPKAVVQLIKRADSDEPDVSKRVVGAMNLPLAPRDRPWDADAAVQRVRRWASKDGSGNKETIDWNKYSQAFFWRGDPGEGGPDFSDFKLPFADVINGQLHAIPRGIFAVAAVLQGARGGVDIPEADQQAIRRKVSQYYARMRKEFDDDSLVPPWEQEKRASEAEKAEDGSAMTFGEALRERRMERLLDESLWDMLRAFQESVQSILRDESVTDKATAIRQAADEFAQGVADLAEVLATLSEADLEKVGRKISAERLARLRAIKEALEQLIAEAEQTPNGGEGTVNKGMEKQPNGAAPEGAQTLDVEKAAQQIQELQKRLEEAEKRAREAEEIAKQERERRLNAEYVQKAKSFEHLPGWQPEEFGPILRKIHEAVGDETYAKLEQVLRGADEAIAKGQLFAELGKGESDDGDVAARIEAAAKELQKNNPALTHAAAVAKVLEQNPELARAYYQDRRQRQLA